MAKSVCGKSFLVILVSGFINSMAQVSAEAATPQVRGQWQGNMGLSGLRRFYSAGGDMGEVVNRAVSYQTANRVWQSQQGSPDAPAAGDVRSKTDSWAIQNDSLFPIAAQVERPVYARVLVRMAGREEQELLSSRSDRLDLGILYAPTQQSYLGLGFAIEESSSDILYADGRARGQTLGPRVDAGLMLSASWSAGIRYDYLRYSGNSDVSVLTPGGRLHISRDSKYERQYLQLGLIGRFSSAQLSWLPEGMVLGWDHGLQVLRNDHEAVRNSLGQQTTEPFGYTERLAVFRSSLSLSKNLGSDGVWSLNGEVSYDYEVSTNMDFPLDNRHGVVYSAALVHQLARGKRVQVLLDRYQHTDRSRTRNSVTLIGVIDF